MKIQFLVGGWPTPLKNMSGRQLGWWNSQYLESHLKFHGSSHHQPDFVMTNPQDSSPKNGKSARSSSKSLHHGPAGRLRGVASGAPKERTALGGTVPFLGVHGHFLRGVTAMYSCGGWKWLQMMGFGGVCEGFCTYCTLFRGMGSLIILNLIVIRMSRILKFSGSWWIERNGGISWVIRWRVNVLHGNWSMFCLDLLAWVCLGMKGTETEHTSEDPAEMFSLW